MTMISKTLLAALLIVGGAAGATHVQAGAGAVSFSPDGFESRCLEEGGEFAPYGNGYLCSLESTDVACVFESIYGYCEWDGGQFKREVLAVIGQPTSSSLSEIQDGRKKLKLVFMPVNPNLNLPNFP